MRKDVDKDGREKRMPRRESLNLGQVYRARVTLVNRAGDSHAIIGVLPTSSVVAAREAFLRGDFGACLTLLDGTVVDDRYHAEVIFLRARALLRLKRPREALPPLVGFQAAMQDADEACTAKMLHGTAVARNDEAGLGVEHGLELLAAVAREAEARLAHPSIRAEIAYYRALAHWTKNEHREASSFAERAERPQFDILSVRAMELQGFIAIRSARYHDALKIFYRALKNYGACRGRDVDLATQIIHQIATLEQMLRSATVHGTHKALLAG